MIDQIYVHAYVDVEGIGTVHCWAVLMHGPNGKLYMGKTQMDPIGPMWGSPDPVTGIRPQYRRQFVAGDEVTLRKALAAELRRD